ncbi:MAG: hypothetical protein OEZ37_08915 [Gemmatimonadota bacterium]|nr:hypothetical protein [Gemmatimonadota bacterium]
MIRSSVTPLLAVLAACAPDGDTWNPAYFPDGEGTRHVASCEEVRHPPNTDVSLMRSFGDTLVVVDGAGGRTLVLDRAFDILAEIPHDPEGPAPLLDPRGVALTSDSVLVFADRPLARLQFITLGGTLARTVDLPFMPDALQAHGAGFLTASTQLGAGPDQLLYFVDAQGGVTELGEEPRGVDPWQLRTLANLVAMAPVAGGTAVAHRFVVPEGYAISSPDGTGLVRVTRHALPVPEHLSSRVGWLPAPPFDGDALMEILTPVLDMDATQDGRELLLLSRSGRRGGPHHEKIVIRTAGDFAFVESIRLPVNAGHLVAWGGRGGILVADDQDHWYTCVLP